MIIIFPQKKRMKFYRENSDLSYGQHVKSIGNRQTFHPNKLDYDLFNIEIDIGPINLFLHGLFLKKLWWVKVRFNLDFLSRIKFHFIKRKISSVGIKCFMIFANRT
jgi:hypothetical protein